METATSAKKETKQVIAITPAPGEVPLNLIIQGPENLGRPGEKKNNAAEIAELSESLRTAGMIEPLVVKPANAAGKFEIIAGNRRFLAAKAAGMKVVPIRVYNHAKITPKEVAIIENFARKDLAPSQKAELVAFMASEAGGKQADRTIGKKLGVSHTVIQDLRKLAALPPEARKAIDQKSSTLNAELLIQAIAKKDPKLAEAVRAKAVETGKAQQAAKAADKKKPAKKSNHQAITREPTGDVKKIADDVRRAALRDREKNGGKGGKSTAVLNEKTVAEAATKIAAHDPKAKATLEGVQYKGTKALQGLDMPAFTAIIAQYFEDSGVPELEAAAALITQVVTGAASGKYFADTFAETFALRDDTVTAAIASASASDDDDDADDFNNDLTGDEDGEDDLGVDELN